MEANSLLLHSKTTPFYTSSSLPIVPSLRHFNKHPKPTLLNLNPHSHRIFITHPHRFSQSPTRPKLSPPLSSSLSDSTNPKNPFPKPLENLSLHSLKATLTHLTPYDAVKWSAVVAAAISAAKWTVSVALNPFFWLYFSWSWMFWPWLAAIALAAYGLYCSRKHSRGEATIFEQIAAVTSAFAWLTLVPPAHFNGFLEGWPIVFFLVYHYFFFFNVSVRKRLYGDYFLRPHDAKWDVRVSEWKSLLFCVGVMVGHWLAAFEGPELQRIPGGLSNVGIWVLILVTLLMQYHSTLYLAKYSEKVVVPTSVVQFGPYRWVRHPIYASTMLLFVTFCVAMRAPFAMVFVVGVCLCYYDQKAKLEEGLMVEAFGDAYVEYARKVRYKFIPFVY